DDIIVTIPAKAGEKHFKPEQRVKLINPKITADGKAVKGRVFTNYILTADDMLPAEESK
ncbi:conjugal transfer protein, partial [Clostridioides difficile]|nr:conjugal transfer protein [Clostridioides difficile]